MTLPPSRDPFWGVNALSMEAFLRFEESEAKRITRKTLQRKLSTTTANSKVIKRWCGIMSVDVRECVRREEAGRGLGGSGMKEGKGHRPQKFNGENGDTMK